MPDCVQASLCTHGANTWMSVTKRHCMNMTRQYIFAFTPIFIKFLPTIISCRFFFLREKKGFGCVVLQFAARLWYSHLSAPHTRLWPGVLLRPRLSPHCDPYSLSNATDSYKRGNTDRVLEWLVLANPDTSGQVMVFSTVSLELSNASSSQPLNYLKVTNFVLGGGGLLFSGLSFLVLTLRALVKKKKKRIKKGWSRWKPANQNHSHPPPPDPNAKLSKKCF